MFEGCTKHVYEVSDTQILDAFLGRLRSSRAAFEADLGGRTGKTLFVSADEALLLLNRRDVLKKHLKELVAIPPAPQLALGDNVVPGYPVSCM